MDNVQKILNLIHNHDLSGIVNLLKHKQRLTKLVARNTGSSTQNGSQLGQETYHKKWSTERHLNGGKRNWGTIRSHLRLYGLF
jgi:hypothetical protein